MLEPALRRGVKTREAILIAAEIVFAERGFDGARIDTIAHVSGYNKTTLPSKRSQRGCSGLLMLLRLCSLVMSSPVGTDDRSLRRHDPPCGGHISCKVR